MQKIWLYSWRSAVALLAAFGIVMVTWLATGKAQLHGFASAGSQASPQPKRLTVKSEHVATSQLTIDATVCQISAETSPLMSTPSLYISNNSSRLSMATTLSQAQSVRVGDWRRFIVSARVTTVTFTDGTSAPEDVSYRFVRIIAANLRVPAGSLDYCEPRGEG